MKRILVPSFILVFAFFAQEALAGDNSDMQDASVLTVDVSKSPMDLFWKDISYRKENATKEVACYPNYYVTRQKRAGWFTGRKEPSYYRGSLEPEKETSEVWTERDRIYFMNFHVDFSQVMTDDKLQGSSREFTLVDVDDGRRSVVDVVMSPLYNQGYVAGFLARFYVVKKDASRKTRKERWLEGYEKSYISITSIDVSAIRGTDFKSEVRGMDGYD